MFVKYFIIVLTSFFLMGTGLLAKDTTGEQDSIKALVAKVKKAPASKKRVLMNELKIKLRSMHKETRRQVMLDLRHSFNQHNPSIHKDGMKPNMHNQNTMMMNESRNMQEYMDRDAIPDMNVPTQKPSGMHPQGQRPTSTQPSGQRPPNSMPMGGM